MNGFNRCIRHMTGGQPKYLLKHENRTLASSAGECFEPLIPECIGNHAADDRCNRGPKGEFFVTRLIDKICCWIKCCESVWNDPCKEHPDTLVIDCQRVARKVAHVKNGPYNWQAVDHPETERREKQVYRHKD
jgi:hypothetical protein